MKYRISPIDPIISRDARQFGAGSPMHPLNWLTNSLISGSVRTVLWKMSEDPNNKNTLDNLKKVAVNGVFPVLNNKIYFPKPLDIVKSSTNIYQVKPRNFAQDTGANMPLNGLIPAFPDSEEDFKPEKLNAFWSRDLIVKWLNYGKNNFYLDEKETLSAPGHDERVHAAINPKAGVSKDGDLFSTTGLDFVHKENENFFSHEQISVDIESDNLPERFIASIGGERRLAEFLRNDEDKILWEYPQELLISSNKIRLVLATPAIFSKGWLPDWIDENNLTGIIPNTNTKLKLISAVVDRWLPISGWSYERGNTGPKPIRRAVPAGSVYFFEIIEGNLDAEKIWLKSICTDEQNINDGFGLVLIGNW